MTEKEKALFQEEISELTNLMRNDHDWADLRAIMENQNINQDDVLLAAFYEDEDEHEFGVIVSLDKRIFEYERDTDLRSKPVFKKWVEKTHSDELFTIHPQAFVALEMINTV